MRKEFLTRLIQSARKLFPGWPALGIMITGYALLLTASYVFVTTREATATQVVVTVLMALVILFLFFVLQWACAGVGNSSSLKGLLSSSLKNTWKLFFVSLPVIAFTVLAAYMLLKLQTRFSLTSVPNPTNGGQFTPLTPSAVTVAPQRIEMVLMSLRYLLVGLFAPLALIHLWISVISNGVLATLKHMHKHLGKAFAPRAVITYMAGLLVFAVIPYFVLFKTTTTFSVWGDLVLLGARLTLVFFATLLGWAGTIRFLARGNRTVSHTIQEQV